VTDREFPLNPVKSKCTFGCKSKIKPFKTQTFIYKIEYLDLFMKNNILYLVFVSKINTVPITHNHWEKFGMSHIYALKYIEVRAWEL